MSSSEFVKLIKEKASIAEVIGEFVRLKKSGSNYTGLCPFHSERSPSFSVSESKGIYHCFGCQESGDVISFIQKIQSLSFMGALSVLAQKFELAIPKEISNKTPGEQNKNDVYFRLNHFVAKFYHEMLMAKNSESARKYLDDRGIALETAKKYWLGFAPNEWSELLEKLEKVKAPIAQADNLGLIRKRSDADSTDKKDRKYFDFYRNRLMIPVLDSRGRVIAFGARALGDEKPKYLNSSDSPIFKKGNNVYGLFQAQKDIRAEDFCIIVEGYMDCLALHQSGIGNVVATLGTALTKEQIELLQRFTSNFVVIFDGDQAGIAAQAKAMETFLNTGIIVKGVSLPDQMDPDEYVQKVGREAFLNLVQKAPYILDEKILELAGASHSLEGKAKALDVILPWIKKIPSDAMRFIRVQQLSSVFNVPIVQIEQNIGGKTPQNSRVSFKPTPRQDKLLKIKDNFSSLELRFLELCIANPGELFKLGFQQDVASGFSNEVNLKIYESLYNSLQETFTKTGKKHFNSEILDLFEDPKIKSNFARALVTLDIEKDTQSASTTLEFQDLNARLIRRSKEKRRDQLRAHILKAENSGRADELAKLMNEYNDLVKTLER